MGGNSDRKRNNCIEDSPLLEEPVTRVIRALNGAQGQGVAGGLYQVNHPTVTAERHSDERVTTYC